ncbi:MAG: hypothetical protein IH911_00905 [Proteobacteria bacterium]|nr:hypothetical protein [Pseudomonadota bacterium]
MTSDSKDEEMIYGLTVDEHDALQRELRELPDTMPPRAVWQRIREQAEAEGLFKRPMTRRPSTWYAGIGLAAAIAFAALIVPGLNDNLQRDLPTLPENPPTNTTQLTALQALMVESRQLESDLRALPGQPRVRRAGTVATISEIEDRIAAIDYQLNDSGPRLSPGDEEIFWRERVRLMNSLLRLRYAQTQRTAF